jgi:adiponectin receptor
MAPLADILVISPDSKESTASTASRQSSANESKESATFFFQTPPTLLTFDQIPAWLQDNDCIRGGYRPISHSVKECLLSWSYMHNESISIFTHLVPAILFLFSEVIIQPLFEARYPGATVADRIVFAVFLSSATICLGISAFYHTLLNHSKQISELSLRCDFVGIVVLTLGFFISGVYIGFYCDQKLRWIYWGMVCVSCYAWKLP